MINLSNEFGLRAKKHLEEEYFIWLTTVSSDMTPQPRPVWFIWDENGTKRYEMYYKKGNKVGHWKMWNEKGELTMERNY